MGGQETLCSQRPLSELLIYNVVCLRVYVPLSKRVAGPRGHTLL